MANPTPLIGNYQVKEESSAVSSAGGVVHTRPWTAELILNLAGYTADENLVDNLAVEPAAGDGAFLVEMVERLIASCRRQGRPVTDCAGSLLAYEVDSLSAGRARHKVSARLRELGIKAEDAPGLVHRWVRQGDYLLESIKRQQRQLIFSSAEKASTTHQADFVIGNPPYIRLEDIPANKNSLYRKNFSTMKGRADVYVAFFEAALRQLKHGGVCAFICADRWMLNHYGSELRRLITSGYSVEVVIEMHEVNAFESEVSAYPAITVIRRRQQQQTVVARAGAAIIRNDAAATAKAIQALYRNGSAVRLPRGLRAFRSQDWFKGQAPWPCTSPDRLKLLKRLEQDFLPLESEATKTKVGIGVATGLDEIYITQNRGLVERDRLLPLALTSDTRDGELKWSGNYLVNPWNESGLISLENFPRLKAYYEGARQQIRSRNVARRDIKKWYRTIDRVNHKLIGQRKLYIPDIKNMINPVLDEGQTYPHHNLYFVVSDIWDLEILGALLLSDIGRFFVECYGVKMRGGYLRMQAQYLRRIRVPLPESVSTRQGQLLRQAFRSRDVKLATRLALDLYSIDQIPAED